MVYASERAFICGTPWAKPIVIPLIADHIPANRRGLMGMGTDVAAEAMWNRMPR